MTSWLRVRRVLDRAVAAVLLVPLAPLLGVLALRIRSQDGVPSFVGLERVGLRGRRFRMWKLRTMIAAAEDGTAAGPSLSGSGDERVTPLGNRLRARRFDELPQLWNVVRGEMALFGPRPEAPEFVEVGDDRWAAVLAMAPGISGATQLLVHEWEHVALSSGDRTSRYLSEVLPRKLAIDEWYVRSASPRVDAAVLVETANLALGRRPGRSLAWLRRTSPVGAWHTDSGQ